MHAFMLALGTRGDVELIASLGRALCARGHRVTLGVSGFHVDAVRSAGLEAAPLGSARRDGLEQVLRALGAIEDRAARVREYYRRWLRPEIEAAKPRIGALAGQADYFVSNLKMVLARDGRRMPGAFIDYDLPPDPADLARYGAATPEHRATTLDLVALSRPLVDPEGRWGAQFRFTGFWEGSAPARWQPGAKLCGAVQGAARPVVLTLGSMTLHDPGVLAARFAEALARLGRSGVLVTAWSRLEGSVDARVHVEPEVPYRWLFPRAACVVHHGGTGTTGAVVRAGTPSVLLPQIASQAAMGEALARARLASAVLETRTLDAGQLATAIEAAISDPEIAAAAAHWRAVVASEPGAAGAAELIDRHWHALCSGGHR